jgi:hypothetical protein
MPLLAAFLPLPLSVYLFQNLPVLDKLLPNVFAPPPLEQLIPHYKNNGQTHYYRRHSTRRRFVLGREADVGRGFYYARRVLLLVWRGRWTRLWL